MGGGIDVPAFLTVSPITAVSVLVTPHPLRKPGIERPLPDSSFTTTPATISLAKGVEM
jgi:hypothetical protein